MAFTTNDGGATQKQNLNLSSLAEEVIESDIFTFRAKTRAGFLNRIFSEYYPIADASISRILTQLSAELSMSLSDIIQDEKLKQKVIKRLLKQKEATLISKTTAYEMGENKKFWLNKENFEYLTGKYSECKEDAFYSRRSKYIKSVLEEYARLPYIQRERIYFFSFFEEIEAAIREKWQLRVVTGTGYVYSFYPYEILCDPLSTANYLVGYIKRYDHPEDEKRPRSFRISALKSIRAEKSKSAFLPKEEKKQLEQVIAARGVQFISSGEEEIFVRLTETGKAKYRRQLHLRPVLARKESEDIYVFDCTTAQAEFYFFKFGATAEILHPSELREKFITLYRDALNLYLATGPNALGIINE